MHRWLIVLAACGDNAVATPRVHDGFLHDTEGRALISGGQLAISSPPTGAVILRP